MESGKGRGRQEVGGGVLILGGDCWGRIGWLLLRKSQGDYCSLEGIWTSSKDWFSFVDFGAVAVGS